jgi:SAM-dependent methyltransferase
MKTVILRVLRRLGALLFAEQAAEWRADFRRLRQLHVETRLRLARVEALLTARKDAKKAPDKAHRDRGAARRVEGPRVPLTQEQPDRHEPSPAAQGTSREVLVLDACPVCGSTAWTVVCEYNKLLLLERGPDPDARVYDYAVCHACGILFARRRPTGQRYRELLERFEVSLGRAGEMDAVKVGSALGSARLTPDAADALRRRAVRGVFVSEHARNGDHMPQLWRDRIACSVHIDLLTSLLSLDRPRILEIRPRFGAIGAGLKRLCGAEVYGLPLFEAQQLLNREVYGHTVDYLLDYDHFAIRYEGSFDLIVANHMFTHAIRPAEFLRLAHERLAPGGHLYLYNEPNDAEFLDHHESMFKVLNAFHFQAFDPEALQRALCRHGFEMTFVKSDPGGVIVLAAKSERQVLFVPMTASECETRISRYRVARDLAILRIPARLRPLFADEWDQVVERALLTGIATLTPDGHLRVRRETDPRRNPEHDGEV